MIRKIWALTGVAVLTVGLAGAQEKKAKGKAGDVAKGKETFEQCAACHATDTDENKMGPSLKGLFKRAKLKNGKPVTEPNIKAVINVGGKTMPAYADLLSDDEKDDVLAYLKTL